MNPAKPGPIVQTSVSADVIFRTCVHELARALEQLTSKEEIPLYATRVEFEEAGIRLAGLLSDQKCSLKGGHG